MFPWKLWWFVVKSYFERHSFHPWRKAGNDWVKGYRYISNDQMWRHATRVQGPGQWVSLVTSTSGWEKSPSFSESRRMIEQTQSVCVFFQLIGKCVYNSIKHCLFITFRYLDPSTRSRVWWGIWLQSSQNVFDWFNGRHLLWQLKMVWWAYKLFVIAAYCWTIIKSFHYCLVVKCYPVKI